MKVKDFAEKYGVPYQVAYASTWLMKPDFRMRRDRQYDEQAMKDAVTELLSQRIKRHQSEVERNKKILAKMNESGGENKC